MSDTQYIFPTLPPPFLNFKMCLLPATTLFLNIFYVPCSLLLNIESQTNTATTFRYHFQGLVLPSPLKITEVMGEMKGSESGKE